MAASEYRLLGWTLRSWAIGIGVCLAFGLLFDFLPERAQQAIADVWPMLEARVLAPAMQALAQRPVQTLLEWLVTLLLAPGIGLVYLVWSVILRQASNPFVAAEAGRIVQVFSLIAMVGGSWVGWRTIISRCAFLLGAYDPFVVLGGESRRWVLRGWVKLRDLLDSFKFGREATGGWAGFIEVLSNRYYPGDVFLGRPRLFGFGMLRPIGLPTEKHMVTIAGTGSGKSTAAMIPNLCIHEGSLLCIDPKGELARITARRRGPGGNGVWGMGQHVHVLDPFNVAGFGATSRYNVFDEMAEVALYDSDRPVSYAGKIAEALVRPAADKDPYWDNAARTLLRGLILYVFVWEPVNRRSLVRLRELIMQGDVEAHRLKVRAGTIRDGDLTPHDVLIEKMRATRDGPYGSVIAGAASSLDMMGANQRGGVLTTAQEHTAFLDAPELSRVCSGSDFLLEHLKSRPTSVYVCLPPNMVAGKEGNWLRMFVLLFIDMMMRVQQAPKPPVLIAIDEFPSLGRLEGIELVAPVLRSYGARLWAVGQDIEQFKRVYPDSWGGFIGGAEAVQFMGTKHPETVDFIVKLLGTHVVRGSESIGGRTRPFRTERRLLEPEQVSRTLAAKKGNQIIWRGDARPMRLAIAPYFDYMPAYYYDADARYREKLRHRLRRPWFTKGAVLPPPFQINVMIPPQHDDPPDQPRGSGALATQAVKGSAKQQEPIPPAGDAPPNLSRSGSEAKPEWVPDTVWQQILASKRSEIDPPRPIPDSRTSEDALAELDALIGLSRVKTKVREVCALVEHHAKRRKEGLRGIAMSHHLVFTGNPGTGKTTVARIVARIYKDLGVLAKGQVIEVDRAGLVAPYLGQTAIKTQAVIESALDGVLFIDEAYALAPRTTGFDDYGSEAIATLLKAMEDNRDRLVVIVAGYTDLMTHFIDSNPGLKSRFNTVIEFDDYDSDDLVRIFEKMCSDVECRMSWDAKIALEERVTAMKADAGKDFGNGRDVRNLLEQCITRQAVRLAGRDNLTRTDITMIEASDIRGAAATLGATGRSDEKEGRKGKEQGKEYNVDALIEQLGLKPLGKPPSGKE